MVETFVIVGSGAAGLAALYTLKKYGANVKIHLVEEGEHFGGHANTVSCNGEDVDVGFMVMNEATYPNVIRIFQELNISLQSSDMSLSVSDTKISWSFQSSYAWLFKAAFSPRTWNFVSSHKKFSVKAQEYLKSPTNHLAETVGSFCSDLDKDFVDYWLIPFVSAVWSAGVGDSREFAIIPLLKFMDNHRFLGLATVPWITPAKRSKSYVQAILQYCGDSVEYHLNDGVVLLNSKSKFVQLRSGKTISYDKIILANSATKQSELSPPSKQWLQKFSVSRSRVIGHTSPYGMPLDKSEWSSWNVLVPRDNSSSVADTGVARLTYWLSKIQTLANPNVFVTVNPSSLPSDIFFDSYMEHPVMDRSSFEAQLDELNHQGKEGVYHAGAWLRHGFHEDAFVTGIIAARRALGDKQIAVEYPTGMTGIYEPVAISGVTVHTRHLPIARTFSYPLYLYEWNLMHPPHRFNRLDFFGDPSIPLDTLVRQTLCEKLGVWPLGKIMAVANLRYLGYNFNPITPYYAYDERDELVALLCEVHNTPWGERCLYAMHVNKDGTVTPSVHAKTMHVSPFNPPPPSPPSNQSQEWTYSFTLSKSEYLSVQVLKNNETVLTADMKMSGRSRSHQVPYGAWLALLRVYIQAAMLAFKLQFFGYEGNTQKSYFDIDVLSCTAILIPAMQLISNQLYVGGSTLIMLTSCLVMYQLSGGSNLLALIGGLACSLIYICLLFLIEGFEWSWIGLVGFCLCAFFAEVCFPSPSSHSGVRLHTSAQFIFVSLIPSLFNKNLVMPKIAIGLIFFLKAKGSHLV